MISNLFCLVLAALLGGVKTVVFERQDNALCRAEELGSKHVVADGRSVGDLHLDERLVSFLPFLLAGVAGIDRIFGLAFRTAKSIWHRITIQSNGKRGTTLHILAVSRE